MSWFGIDVCTYCQAVLNSWDKMHSGGICPRCGFDSKCTICDTDTIILQETKHHKWWQFWKRKYTYRAADGDKLSQDWLIKNPTKRIK